MGKTTIGWTQHSINPIRARHRVNGKVGHYCELVSAGCAHCYSSRMQQRFEMPHFAGAPQRAERFAELEVFLAESKLHDVLRRKKPTTYFWCDMTDMFGEWVHLD